MERAGRFGSRRLAPAVVEPVGRVLRVDTTDGLVGNQGHARVRITGDTLAILGEVDAGVNTKAGHLQRILLRGGRDPAVFHPANARTTAVNRDDQHAILLAPVLERLVDAKGRRLVDRIDDVDTGVLGQAVLHRRLALDLVPTAVGDTDDLRVAVA